MAVRPSPTVPSSHRYSVTISPQDSRWVSKSAAGGDVGAVADDDVPADPQRPGDDGGPADQGVAADLAASVDPGFPGDVCVAVDPGVPADDRAAGRRWRRRRPGRARRSRRCPR